MFKKLSSTFILPVLVVGLAFAMVIVSTMRTVTDPDRGLLFRNGAFVKVLEPGLHFKMPFIDKVEDISLQTWTTRFEKLQAYSNDQQQATMRVSVTWMVEPSKLKELYMASKNLAVADKRYIGSITPTEVENTFGKYTAENMIKNRADFVAELGKNITNSMPSFIHVVSVQVENIDFSDAYEQVVEDRAMAEVAVRTATERESKEIIENRIKVNAAQALADSNLAKDKAKAAGISAIAEAEAEAILRKGTALKLNPELVELTKAERWDGKLPNELQVVPNSSIPFLNMK